MKRFLTILFLGAVAFAGGLAGTAVIQNSSAIAAPTDKNVPPPPPPAVAPAPAQSLSRTPAGIASLGERFESVISKVAPTVVAIEASKPPAQTAAGRGSGKLIEESGSGVLVRMPGVQVAVVITNNHVISGAKAEQITIHLADNRLFHPARIWADPESDIAALRLDLNDLPATVLGDSDRTRVGEWVLAFGSPFGLNQTVTHGIISGERGQVGLGNTIRIKDFLQTDAAINPGSSGGPLVNLDGEVIGINTAIASHSGSNSGVAFSIPVNLVKRIVKQLIETGSVTRGYLGVHLAQTMEPARALELGLERVQGALVESIHPDSPASRAGLRADDVILQIDGLVIRNENHLINLVSALPAGQRVRLKVWRERKSMTVEASVGDWGKARARLNSD